MAWRAKQNWQTASSHISFRESCFHSILWETLDNPQQVLTYSTSVQYSPQQVSAYSTSVQYSPKQVSAHSTSVQYSPQQVSAYSTSAPIAQYVLLYRNSRFLRRM